LVNQVLDRIEELIMERKRVLFIGDAACPSGFAKNTHGLIRGLDYRETPGGPYEIMVLGINFNGDTPTGYPYPIRSAMFGGDWSGQPRIPELMAIFQPDVVIVQNDPWNFPSYLKRLKDVPVIGVVAVDSLNCQGDKLNGLACAVFWTKFGETEAIEGGYSGKSVVIPCGVDLHIYKPLNRKECRQKIGFKDHLLDAFIVGNVNRNGPRKRFDLCIEYFAEWVATSMITDAILYLQQAPTDDGGFDIEQLARYFGKKYDIPLNDYILTAIPPFWVGWPDSRLAEIYSMLDVMWSPSQGEGFGLPTIEGMACGTPQIVSDWAAYSDWAKDAACLIRCSATNTTPMLNTIGGVADKIETIQALDTFYHHVSVRAEYSRKGSELVAKPEYRWENIGTQFAQVVANVLEVPFEQNASPSKTAELVSLEVPV
jgi:D-inositol-3-phosphate glycosyltransferase